MSIDLITSKHQCITMNRKPNQPVPALNDIDRPPLEIDDEQKKFILTFGSFAKQAKREGRYDDLFNHATSRWWMKWPLDHAPTPLAITRSRLVSCPNARFIYDSSLSVIP